MKRRKINKAVSTRVRCPDCGKEADCIRLKNGFTIYFANVKFVWYKCTRCNKTFTKKIPIEKKKK